MRVWVDAHVHRLATSAVHCKDVRMQQGNRLTVHAGCALSSLPWMQEGQAPNNCMHAI